MGLDDAARLCSRNDVLCGPGKRNAVAVKGWPVPLGARLMDMTPILIRNCRLFDGLRAPSSEVTDLYLSHGRIETIGPRSPAVGDIVIDAEARMAMPGLIDAHFHACGATIDVAADGVMPASLLAQHSRQILEATLRRGFTTVRDAGGADVGLHLACEQGLIDGPRLFFGGKALSQTGGHGDLRAPDVVGACACAYCGSLTRVVDGTEAVTVAVREIARTGAHHVKLMLSGGVLSPADPIWMAQFSDAEIGAAIDEARRRCLYVMAHAHTADAAIRCASLGVRSIEHGTLIDAAAADAVARAGCYVVPTLAIMDALIEADVGQALPAAKREALEAMMEAALTSIRHCCAAGVPLGFGTDLLGALHARQNREFLLRCRAQAPIDVLRSATAINAALLNRPEELGTLSSGALADILLVNGDPTADIGLLVEPDRGLAMIISRGRIVVDRLSSSSRSAVPCTADGSSPAI